MFLAHSSTTNNFGSVFVYHLPSLLEFTAAGEKPKVIVLLVVVLGTVVTCDLAADFTLLLVGAFRVAGAVLEQFASAWPELLGRRCGKSLPVGHLYTSGILRTVFPLL